MYLPNLYLERFNYAVARIFFFERERAFSSVIFKYNLGRVLFTHLIYFWIIRGGGAGRMFIHPKLTTLGQPA